MSRRALERRVGALEDADLVRRFAPQPTPPPTFRLAARPLVGGGYCSALYYGDALVWADASHVHESPTAAETAAGDALPRLLAKAFGHEGGIR